MTLTGYAYLFMLFLSSVNINSLIVLLVISSLFQSAAAIVIGEIGVPMYAFSQIVIISIILLKIIYTKKQIFAITKKEKLVYLILGTFFILATFNALLLPIAFEGTMVFNPKVGIDVQYGEGNQTALMFSLSNIAQLVYLFLNILTFIILVNYAKIKSFTAIKRVLNLLFIVALFFSSYQLLSFLVIKIPFIDSLLYNNPSYYIGNNQQYSLFHRINGPFLEPSMAGSFFAAFSTAFFFVYSNKIGIIFFFLSIVFLLLSTSSNGYLTFIFAICIILILNFTYSISNKYYKVSQSSIIIILLSIFLLVISFVVFFDKIVNIYDFVIASKGQSDSFIHRLFADKYAFTILLETYGFGCGLGGNRPSSFIPSLLSNMGIIGVSLFIGLIIIVFKSALHHIGNNDIKFLFILFLSIFISMIIAISDLSYSYFWIFSSLLLGATLNKNIVGDNNVDN